MLCDLCIDQTKMVQVLVRRLDDLGKKLLCFLFQLLQEMIKPQQMMYQLILSYRFGAR